MIRAAYLTGARWRGGALDANGLPPPETATYEALKAAGEAAGIVFDIYRWDDADLLARAPQAALIRSCWDYPERAETFAARLDALEAGGIRLINSAALVRWNMNKAYLAEFEKAGLTTIPTLFVERCDARAVLRAFDTFDAAELVIKPAIGAGSRQTIRARRNIWSEMDVASAPSGPALIQPFLPAIESDGERSLFFFGGRFAYAVLKRPAPGSWFANAADTQFTALEASSADRALAEEVMRIASPGLVYARVDIVTNGLGAPALIELEAIEPHLFFNRGAPPAAAGDFVRALADALSPGAGVLGR